MKGICLFVVPKVVVETGERNDVVLAGLNHKMGYRGTTNTLLNFGEGVHTPGGAARRGRLPRRRAAPRPRVHVPHDERGPDRRRVRRDGAGLHRLPQVAAVRQGAPAGPAGRRQGPGLAAGADRPARRRAADAAGAEVLRRGRARAGALLRPAARRGAHRRDRRRARAGPPAARHAHADRQELAVAVVPGGQQPGDPGARRLRLHPRVRRRAALPRQPAQPDPRGHPRHPGPGPAGPQGRPGRRGRAATCWPARSGRPPRGRPASSRRTARSCRPPSTGSSRRPPACGGPATRSWRWPTPRSTWRRSATSSSPGCGWSRRSPRRGAPATSTTASGRRRSTSSATSCPAPGRSWTCSTASTAPPSTSTRAGSSGSSPPGRPGRARTRTRPAAPGR